jgi:hypothetical protein
MWLPSGSITTNSRSPEGRSSPGPRPVRLRCWTCFQRPPGVRDMQERLARRWGVLTGSEVQLDRPGVHHEVCAVPLDDLQPQCLVVSGGSVKVGAAQNWDRHCGKSSSARRETPRPRMTRRGSRRTPGKGVDRRAAHNAQRAQIKTPGVDPSSVRRLAGSIRPQQPQCAAPAGCSVSGAIVVTRAPSFW